MTRYRIEWNHRHIEVDDRCVIGRDPECDIQLLADASVSRRHFIFEVNASGYVVTDLDSKNGSWVDGERLIGSRQLHGPRLLRVGKTEVRVSIVTRDGPHENETLQGDDSALWKHDVLRRRDGGGDKPRT